MAATHHSADPQHTPKEKGLLARFFTQKPRYQSDFILLWAAMTAAAIAVIAIYAWRAPDTVGYLQDYGFTAVISSVTAAVVLYAFYRDVKKHGTADDTAAQSSIAAKSSAGVQKKTGASAARETRTTADTTR